tara:strand:+ start:1003 stop:1707 length:705 start_codon:yes stop_codon:yes gene_type:complete
MNPILRFLLAARSMSKQGMKKEQILDFAKREFGEVPKLLKNQIDDIFKKPATGGKKPGEVVPIKKKEGIETLNLPESSDVDMLRKNIEQLQNLQRPGGGLDPVTGLTRTLTRRILEKKGIQIGKNDPIDLFNDIFGESIIDVTDLAEEMIEIDRRGGGIKNIDQMLQGDGFFDIKIPKNPNRGIPNKELIEQLKKDLKQKEILKGAVPPKGRKPNAEGGRVKMAKGGLPNILGF